MKHIFMIAFIILVFLTGIFLPYSEGEYDNFTTGISLISQLTIFFALLLVPVGMILILITGTAGIRSSCTLAISVQPLL